MNDCILATVHLWMSFMTYAIKKSETNKIRFNSI